jgi:predicted dinucleotide-binding enzyme
MVLLPDYCDVTGSRDAKTETWSSSPPVLFPREGSMRIGIIGAGNIGGTLTRRLTALGHDVKVANSRGPETLGDLARETGAEAVPAPEAAEGAELVVVTIPMRAIPLLPGGLLDATTPGAAIVDTGNYYPQRDGRIDAIEGGTTESRWVSEQLGRPVVKAFNNIYARHLLELGRPAGSPDRIALPVAGDDPGTKGVVMALVDELGFDPVDAGSIDESWRQQPGTPVYTHDLDAAAVAQALAEASPERQDSFKA